MSHAVLLPTTKDSTLSKINLTGKHLIGRSLHNTTVIEDINISRSHCYFEQKDGEWLLTDTSSNGTMVNRKLIHNAPHKLQDHDTIELSSKIAYEYLVCMETNQTDIITDEVLNEITDTVLEAKLLVDGDLETSNATQPKSQSEMASKLSDEIKPDLVEEEFQCSICTELFIKAVTLSCSHTFCKHCIGQWRKNQTVCPICRAEIQNQFPTIVLDNYIEKIVESRSDEYKSNRKMIVDEREAEASAAPGPSSSNTNKRRRPASDPIEISSTSGSETENNTDSENDSLYDEDEDDEDDYYCDLVYNGEPGHYYGGYGSCYRCGQRGHWANGCPFKRRR
ncbi:hypothetical protein RI129_012524 [Pyrocoelia pectoralis]|uniref:E3 ubiquitin-protein ligase CHFR n=1 Tax=Pyrocoelia pectoralis TaxID=417401 RepID=A0AAN7V0K1_9COLE